MRAIVLLLFCSVAFGQTGQITSPSNGGSANLPNRLVAADDSGTLQGNLFVSEIPPAKFAKLTAAREKAAKAEAELATIENDIKRDFGDTGDRPSCGVRGIEVELEGKYALIRAKEFNSCVTW